MGIFSVASPLPEKFAYPAYQVLRFKEKPDDVQARQMLASHDHSWNSGMFLWRTDTILAEILRQMPDLHTALDSNWGCVGNRRTGCHADGFVARPAQ